MKAKKLLAMLLALVMMVSLMPMTALAADTATSGTCGDNLTWSFDEASGTLTISGTGAMYDYQYSETPWWKLPYTSVVLPEGIKRIGNHAFSMAEITELTIPEGCEVIGEFALSDIKLKTLTIPKSMKEIHGFALKTMLEYHWLQDVYYGGSPAMWDKILVGPGNMALEGGYPNQIYQGAVIHCALESDPSDSEVFSPTASGTDYYSNGDSNVTWTLENRVLTISGSGAMLDYYAYFAPWALYCRFIEEVVIEPGITNIGGNAFSEYRNLKRVYIPQSVTTINFTFNAFEGGYALTDLFYYGSEAEWAQMNVRVPAKTTVHYNSSAPCSHEETVVLPAKAANCDESGLTEGVKCSACGQVLVSQKIIPATGHTPSVMEAVEPTCSGVGFTEGSECSGCGMILVPQEIIPTIDHTPVTIPGSKPTCVSNGLTEGSMCSVCSMELVAQEVLPMTDHTYGEGNLFIEATCVAEGEMQYPCTVCGMVKSEPLPKIDHTPSVLEAVEPTCTSTGFTEGSECGFCGEVLKPREILPMTDHTEEIIPAVAPTYYKTGLTEGKKCSVCGEVTVAQTVIPQLIEVIEETAKVPEALLEEELSNAVASNAESITLPLDGFISQQQGRTCGAQLPVAALEKIADANKALTVKTNFTHFTVDAAALQAIAEAAKDAEHVSVKIDQMKSSELNESQQASVTKKDVVVVFGAEIVADGNSISDFKGGKVTVEIPVPPVFNPDTERYAVVYIDDMGSISEVPTSYNERTMSVVAELQHFSEYAVIVDKTIANPFTDVPDTEYYYEPVLWALNKGITTGTSDTTFEPDKTCTRGQVVTFLWRVAGQPEPTSSENPFTDVPTTEYYYKAVLWAVEKGITKGTSDTTFSPDDFCTRGQVVTFLYRASKGTPSDMDNPFTDLVSGEFYCEPVLWAVKKGITTGTSETTFSPDASCTRGQIVTFLHRAYN